MAVSTQDLLDSIQGLQGYAKDLRHASQSGPFGGDARYAIPMRGRDLLQIAEFMEGVAQELQRLIPDQPISPPRDTPFEGDVSG